MYQLIIDLQLPVDLLLKTLMINMFKLILLTRLFQFLSQESLLTRSFRTTNIYVLIERDYHYHFKCNYLKPKTFYWFLIACLKSTLSLQYFFKKFELPGLSISDIMDSEGRGYLDA